MEYSKYTAAISRGDREAFRDYMDRTIDPIFKTVCRIIASEDDARDIVQETYIKVWEKRYTLRSEKSIYSWTKRIAINRSLDYLRKRKRRGGWRSSEDISALKNIASDREADDNIKNEEYRNVMRILTSGLSSKQKLVFTLAAIENLPADEIASITGMSKTSIKSNLYHARKAISKRVERIL